MIKFFRNIRRRLLRENKFTRYLFYAIGEIFLVVIGILIALQINNWNETQKNKREEIKILENLKANLVLAKSQSQQYLEQEKNRVKLIKSVLSYREQTKLIDLDTLKDSTMEAVLWHIGFQAPVFNTYTDLKNSNQLDLISNQNLKDKFNSLEISIDGLQSMLADRVTVHQMRIDPIAENDVNFVMFLEYEFEDFDVSSETSNDYKIILTNSRIRNLLAIKLKMTLDVVRDREQLDKDIADLLDTITRELNQLRNE